MTLIFIPPLIKKPKEIEKTFTMESRLNKRNATHETKLATIAAEVPVRGPGNVIEHIKVDFDIYQDGTKYIAFPLLSEPEARLTGLPGSITFFVKDDWINSEQKEFKYLAVDIYSALKKKYKLKV